MFHFSSIVVPLMPALPNLLTLIFKPTDVPLADKPDKTKMLLENLERVGQAGVFVIPLFYPIDLSSGANRVFLALAVLSLLLYYIGWFRFYTQGRKYALYFKPLWVIPVPLALSPIIYFICFAKILNSVPLLIAALIFAIGHIPISYKEYIKTKDGY